MEHITHDNYDRNGDGRGRTVLQNLTGYINDPMREYHNEVKRRIKEASEDIEQIAVKTGAELEKRIMELEGRLKESETLRDRYRNERNDLRKILNNFSKERQQKISNDQELAFKRKIANLENTHEQKEKDWAKKMKDLEEISDDIIKDQKQKIEEMQKQTTMQEMEIKSLQETLEQNSFGFSGRHELEKKLEESQKQLNVTNDKLHRALTRLKHAERELDETKTSLSDKDRPTKLAERYAELYENQWTDAYEIIYCNLGNEEEVIQTLLETLMDVMEFCKSQAKLQLEKLHRTLTFSKQEGEYIHDNVTKQLKDVRKALSNTATQNLYQEYIDHLRKSRDKTLKHAMEIKPFVKECFEICWLMAIQDPPIVLSQTSLEGDVLDTEMYRPYTRTGRLIQFVVWPALLLHESGPILAKGVAQGKSESLDKSKEAWAGKADLSGLDKETYGHRKKDIFEQSRIASTRYNAANEPDNDLGISNHIDKRYEAHREDRHYRSPSAGQTRPSYKQSTVPTSSVGTRAYARELSSKIEMSPTREEMKIYFHYLDRHEYSKGLDRLGYKVYMKCQKREHKRSLYC